MNYQQLKRRAAVAHMPVTADEKQLIIKIAQRAKNNGFPGSIGHLIVDLITVHCQACPLRLEDLLAASLKDFSTDITGIKDNFNFKYGVFDNNYRPRFAA